MDTEKQLYDKQMHYTSLGDEVRNKIKEEVVPIILKYANDGFTEPELLLILHNTVSFELMNNRLINRHK